MAFQTEVFRCLLWFERLDQVREMAWFWRLNYNNVRPHESLGDILPAGYHKMVEHSTLELFQ